MPPELRQTLTQVATAMIPARDPWWIIGSAAVALHGASPVEVRDIDVLLGVADARRILPGLGIALTPGTPDSRFRSDFYCQWNAPPVPVDFMAGFHAFGELLIPETRESVGGVFVPSREELLTILRHFGRAKDLERARLLELAM
ncbi:hypothetical protein [Sphingomonas sp.]|uniref:hypothetical protein n=1 Tax=Sphingomonas sp. TaxID=28214 RepID=UPI0025D31FDE|nr:hypothetical protein [Sphingomonas sp.]